MWPVSRGMNAPNVLGKSGEASQSKPLVFKLTGPESKWDLDTDMTNNLEEFIPSLKDYSSRTAMADSRVIVSLSAIPARFESLP